MTQGFDIKRLIELYGAMLPLALLLTDDAGDQQFLANLYFENERLMYKVARSFFPGDSGEAEDAVQSAVERLCVKCSTLREVACNKRRAYIVTTVRNCCLSRLREKHRHDARRDDSADADTIEQLPDNEDMQGIVFDRIYAVDLLNSFAGLSEKDKQLIRMFHIDRLEYGAIMEVLGYSNEGAARTAVSRAKSRLVKLAEQRKRDEDDA